MMKQIRQNTTWLLTLLVLLASAITAEAQPYWHIVRPKSDGQKLYSFTALSSYGEDVVAAALVLDKTDPLDRSDILILHSTDAGISWIEQDPGLPAEQGMGGKFIKALQIIDAQNIVAAGDSGLIIRSSDGGRTWIDQSLKIHWPILSIHFSDPLTGIVLDQGLTNVYTTSDGGKQWDSASLPATGHFPRYGHSYGHGMFRVLTYFNGGILYTTRDNWKSRDSSLLYSPPSDSLINIYGCAFGSGDTLVAYGENWNPISPVLALTRSTDGGNHWSPITLVDSLVYSPSSISPLERNTVYMGGGSQLNCIGVSNDHGTTWRIDTIALDTTLPLYAIAPIEVTASGQALAICSYGLLRLEQGSARVESFDRVARSTHIYPNPTIGRIVITSVEPLRSVRLFDVIGRESLRDALDEHGQATLDLTSLPRGIYSVMLDHNGAMVPVGKVAVVAK